MHVDPQHVADVVQRVPLVELVLFLQRVLGGGGEDAQPLQTLGEDDHRHPIRFHEVVARLDRCERGRLGPVNQFVNFALLPGELAADWQGARDIRGVERIAFYSGIHQQQRPSLERSIVPGPMKDAGVSTRCEAGAEVEDPFHFALALRGPERRNHVFEPTASGGDGGGQLPNLQRILDQPHLGQSHRELAVSFGLPGQRRVHAF